MKPDNIVAKGHWETTDPDGTAMWSVIDLYIYPITIRWGGSQPPKLLKMAWIWDLLSPYCELYVLDYSRPGLSVILVPTVTFHLLEWCFTFFLRWTTMSPNSMSKPKWGMIKIGSLKCPTESFLSWHMFRLSAHLNSRVRLLMIKTNFLTIFWQCFHWNTL